MKKNLTALQYLANAHHINTCLLGLLAASAILATPAYGIRLIHVSPVFTIHDQLKAPSDISVSPDGRVYIVDGVNSKVRVYSRSGQYLSSFGKPGGGKGELQLPLGIDIDQSGQVYIADAGNHRVQLFSPKGDFIDKIDLPSTPNHPADPTDVVVDESRNRCYIVDNDNHRILVYDLSTLKLRKIYGKQGAAKGEFRYPFLITLGQDNNVYIVDVINTRVQVLNPQGFFVTFIGSWGVEKGEFFRPKGVAIDKKGSVYVSDSYLGVIQVFSPDGDFYAALGDAANYSVRKFKSPTGVFIDEQNRIYVVEMFADRVSVFSIDGESGAN